MKRVPQRYLGAFTGRTTANDLTNYGKYDTMGCCAAAGGRGLYLLWSNAAEIRRNDVYVNMWLSSESEYIDINSEIPEKGKICIKVKKQCTLHVRIPEWLESDKLRLKVNDTICKPVVDAGRYIRIGDCREGTSIELRFPLKTEIKTVKYCGNVYRVEWRGNCVTGIQPRGDFIPLY